MGPARPYRGAVPPDLSAHDDHEPVLVRLRLTGHQPAGALARELLADQLFAAGATGIEERDPTTLLVGFDDRLAALAAVAALPEARRAHATVEVPDDTCLDGWRAYATAERAGRHLVVHPPWVPLDVDPPVGPDDIVVQIDPERAFGSGAHPTSRLVLAELERRVRRGDRVLDVGSGSGVLSVAAGRLGAGTVVAVDIDPAARAATRANLQRNAVHATVTDALPDGPGTAAPFELVVANIGANTLVALAPRLVQLGRVIVLAGFLADRREEVLAAYEVAGATRSSTPGPYEEDGWVVCVVETGAR